MNYRNFVDRQIAFYDDYEARQIAYLTGAMRERGGDLFLDIGANIGLYSVLVARQGLAKNIIDFEPDPRNLYQLGANLLVKGLTGRVGIVAKAVSNRPGPVPFRFFADSSTGQSRIDDNGSPDTVDAVRIDDHVQLRGGIIFAKIDVEGHELEVIEGMTETLHNNKIFLQIESFPEQIEKMSGLLSTNGYTEIHTIGDDHYFANF